MNKQSCHSSTSSSSPPLQTAVMTAPRNPRMLITTPSKIKRRSAAGRNSFNKDTRHRIPRGVQRQRGGSKRCAADLAPAPLPLDSHATSSSSHENNIRRADFQLATSSNNDLIISRPSIRVLQEDRDLDIHNEVSHDGTCNSNTKFVFDHEQEIGVFEPGKNNSSDFVGFADEEEIFNMPILLDSMAEGMLLTPLAMKKGFNWSQLYDDYDDDGGGDDGGGDATEVNLWIY